MRRNIHYIWLPVLTLLLLGSCGKKKPDEKPEVNWNVTLGREDKIPYGSYVAYNSLKYYFADAAVTGLSRDFRFGYMDNSMTYNDQGANLLILVGNNFYVSDKEWSTLKEFAANGNELLIFASNLDEKIENELGVQQYGSYSIEVPYYSLDSEAKQTYLMAKNRPGKRYTYKGRTITGAFIKTSSDTYNDVAVPAGEDKPTDTTDTVPADDGSYLKEENSNDAAANADTTAEGTPTEDNGPDTLGYNSAGYANMIRYSIGQGHITVHAAPLVLSNYFLLQPGNEDYLTALWQMIPGNINRVYWDDYFNHSADESSWSILWRYPATRWALVLSLVGLAIYVLFQMKRRQRIIPIIEPLKNDTVSFVETVGRLYFNKGNHSNLAEKMIQQYLEWVRATYYLNTNILNDEFRQQLIKKSGQDEAVVHAMLSMIHEIRTGAKPDDAFVYQLYRTTELFYNNHHSKTNGRNTTT